MAAVLLLGLAGLKAAGGPVQAAGDAERGARAFQRCYACHSVDPDEKSKLQGPSLYRIIPRRAATVPGFDYSEALRRKGEAGLIWDAETLDRFIADPDALVPGTAMSLPPLRDEQERADLIAYLVRAGEKGP